MRRMRIYAVSNDTVRQLEGSLLFRYMPERMKKAQSYRFERDRLLCVGGGLLMRQVVGIRDESALLYGRYGKPSAPGCAHFNLSHSGEWCVMAKWESEVGVDIEKTDGRHLDVAPAVFTPRELAWMDGNPVERFYQLWTWKESLMKAIGRGLSLEPRALDVLPFAEHRPLSLDGRLWYAAAGGIAGYRYSACASSPIDRLEWREMLPADFDCLQRH